MFARYQSRNSGQVNINLEFRREFWSEGINVKVHSDKIQFKMITLDDFTEELNKHGKGKRLKD